MIKITTVEDTYKIANRSIKRYIQNKIKYFLHEYQYICPNHSIELIGAYYLIESQEEINNYKQIGLSEPLEETMFEWVEILKAFDCEYVNICVNLDNDFSLNIVIHSLNLTEKLIEKIKGVENFEYNIGEHK